MQGEFLAVGSGSSGCAVFTRRSRKRTCRDAASVPGDTRFPVDVPTLWKVMTRAAQLAKVRNSSVLDLARGSAYRSAIYRAQARMHFLRKGLRTAPGFSAHDLSAAMRQRRREYPVRAAGGCGYRVPICTRRVVPQRQAFYTGVSYMPSAGSSSLARCRRWPMSIGDVTLVYWVCGILVIGWAVITASK